MWRGLRRKCWKRHNASREVGVGRALWPGLVLCGAAAMGVLVCGCSRRYYRLEADNEAYQLIEEKETDPSWTIPDFSAYLDPRSRYYDPYDRDHPPMPPDDPESHQFMHCVYGMKGWSCWHEDGDLTDLENPYWQEYLAEFMEVDEEDNYVMQLEDAVLLSLMNVPRYRQNLEDIYLSALDVAFERFRFDVQFFGGNDTDLEHLGSENPGPRSSTLLTTDTDFEMQKLLPTGAQLLTDFVNTFVWQFAGPDRNTVAQSLLSFSIVQPLLRRGGRDVVLERLTISERGLLANLRQMQRYRESFLVDVAMGTGRAPGPSRRGGFLGGAGLTGFTGTAVGGFGGVGQITGFGRFARLAPAAGAAGGAAGAGFAAGVAANVGGLYGLLQQVQQIRNREANLAAQLENLARVEALFDAGRIDSLQVDQFRQNVQSARSQYLDALSSFQNDLDTFLTDTIGLPPDLPIRLDEAPNKPFQFIAPELTELQDAFNVFLETVRAEQSPTLQMVRDWIQEFQRLHGEVGQQIESIGSDFDRMDQVLDQRLESLTTEQERKQLMDYIQSLRENFERLRRQYELTGGALRSLRELVRMRQAREAHLEILSQSEGLSYLLVQMSLLQAGVRLETVVLTPIDLDPERAFRIALANRLDIMNQRAEVVDQWRLIDFNANRLESDLDVEFSGDIGTVGRNPFEFRNQAGRLTVGLEFDAPLTRLAERNQYRESLISYQRVRRDYIQFLDTTEQQLRLLLRRIEQFQQEMELRRAAMRIAIRTVDQTQETLREPPPAAPPPVPGAAPAPAAQVAGLGATAVRDLVGALSDLLVTQNDVAATYLNYELLQMQLYLQLGIIKFDDRGVWIAEQLEDALQSVPEQEPYMPPACPLGHPAQPRPRVAVRLGTIEGL